MTKAALKINLSPSRGIPPDKLVLKEQSAKSHHAPFVAAEPQLSLSA
ncbi:hypothetical protein ML401_24150 [Bradyrhizobium sp. 62B]|nr:hypothetical protein ML401_24150 [Bradyrhizobium sp. 62B]